MRLILTTIILTMLAQPVCAGDQFKSYEDCLIKSLKGVTNDKAVSLIDEACAAAFDASQTTNLQLIETLKKNIEQLRRNFLLGFNSRKRNRSTDEEVKQSFNARCK